VILARELSASATDVSLLLIGHHLSRYPAIEELAHQGVEILTCSPLERRMATVRVFALKGALIGPAMLRHRSLRMARNSLARYSRGSFMAKRLARRAARQAERWDVINVFGRDVLSRVLLQSIGTLVPAVLSDTGDPSKVGPDFLRLIRETKAVYVAHSPVALPHDVRSVLIPFPTPTLDASAPIEPRRPNPTIGYMGRIEPMKRVDLLVGACETLRGRGLKVVVVLAGEGTAKTSLRAATKDMDWVIWHESLVDNAAVVRFLSAIDCLCLPSESEGLPMSILEALAVGVSVVATRVGGIASIEDERMTLVEPGDPGGLADAIAAVLASPPSGSRKASKPRLSEADYGRAYLSLYEELSATREL
jgi:glycosyltransferase involved in cell wall biosynthesis